MLDGPCSCEGSNSEIYCECDCCSWPLVPNGEVSGYDLNWNAVGDDSNIQSRKLGTFKKRDYVLGPGHAEGTGVYNDLEVLMRR